MKEKTVQKELLTAQEVAELLDVNIRTIYRFSRSGKLQSYSFGGRKKYYRYSEVINAVFSSADKPEKARA